jgi:Telomere capping, CST complex subunit
MNGPRPTTRVFLSELPSLPLHSKVRFLGWWALPSLQFNASEALRLTRSLHSVTRYDISTGCLILEHGYPTNLKTPATIPVDINLLLETIKGDEIQAGAWLNVLGYVREQAPQQNDSRALAPETEASIYIEAVMVFSAGAIHVGDYERILRDSLEVDRRVNRPT